ncbi:MAG TPA: ABC transporter permease [Candidatus Acidoferrales bacterium]|jgi:predicted permease|nr:ABC transporter permease [Candidatus Acidoferrales bacterium]
MRTLWQDLRYGLRMLAKSPGFAAVAILTLALGIGANTAIFSIVNGVLINPLPFPHPQELTVLYEHTANFEKSSISYPNFLDWQRTNTTFASMAAYRSEDFNITGSGEPERVRGGMVSAEFFPIFGVKPLLGRLFVRDEDRLGAAPVALLAEGFWQRRFGSARDIIGKQIIMNGDAYTIVGVIPASFHFRAFNFGGGKDVYVPVGQTKDPLFYHRDDHKGMDAIGRLKPGVPLAAAQADMAEITGNLAAAYPDADKGAGAAVMPLRDELVDEVRPFLWLLLGAVGFVLLIACVNVGNLQLARSAGRAHEFAIRCALGADRWRVVRQLLTESVALGLAGGAIGACAAAWGTEAAIRLLPETLPRAEDVGLDGHVLVFTLAISFLTSVAFGLVPALKMSRRSGLQETLKEGGRGASAGRQRAQSVFVVGEMALALVLLTGAGLMIRTLARLWSVHPGFNPENVLVFDVTLAPSLGANAATTRSAIRELSQTLRAIPGVQAASVIGGAVPMSGSDNELPFWIDGQTKPVSVSEMNLALTYFVEPGYLKAMQIPLLRGRFIAATDDEHSPPVVVIDENFARQYFPGQDPIGRRIHTAIVSMDPEIVGVVGHVKHWGLDLEADRHPLQEQIYSPLLQIPDAAWSGPPQAGVVLRSAGSPQGMVGAVREAIVKLNGQNVMYETDTMEAIIAESLGARRFSMILLSIFATLALLLSGIGIYGVISYVVGQRTREIGIRIALGAQRSTVLWLMLGEGMKMAMIGVVVGIVAAAALTRLMSQLIYGVSAADPVTFAGVIIVLTTVAFVACYVPARRAMRVDPMVALRYE